MALVAGAAAGARWEPDPTALVAPLLMAWALAAVGLAVADPRTVVCLATGFLAAGLVLGSEASLRRRSPERLEAPLPEGPVRLEGRVRRDASPTEWGATLEIDADTSDQSGPGPAVRGGVRLAVYGSTAASRARAWTTGRRVAVWATVSRPDQYLDPGQPDRARALAARGIVAVGSVKSGSLADVLDRGNPWDEAAAAVRRWIRQVVGRHVGAPPDAAAGVVNAILIGDRAGLPDEVEERLQRAGTYHVIAISGGNVALLAAVLLTVWRVSGRSRRVGALVAAAALAAYAALAGGGPSVTRATLVAVVDLLASAIDLRGPPLNVLAASALMLVAVDPLATEDPGFVLSFVATAAILAGAGAWATSWTAAYCRVRRVVRAPIVVRFVTTLFAATLCAEIAVLPIGASTFARVTGAGLLLNFAAVPLMAVVQIAGLALLAATPVDQSAAALCGAAARLAAIGLVESARAVDVAPWVTARVPPPPWWLVLTYAGAWTAYLAGARRRLAAAVGLVTGILIVTGAPLHGLESLGVRDPLCANGFRRTILPGKVLRATVLDVGQGDSTLLQMPDGHAVLVDAGGLPMGGRFDIGADVVAPSLWALGVRRLDTLVVTHGDPDHAGGAEAVLSDFRPGEIWEGVPVFGHGLLRRLTGAATRQGVTWRRTHAGETIRHGAVEVTVLAPPLPDWERQQVRNDDSIVLAVLYGGVSIVLPGDIGGDVEGVLASRVPAASLTILKLAHHGSRTSTSERFLDTSRPVAAIASAGRDSRFGHPHPEVLERLARRRIAVLRTDRDGAISVETDGEAVLIRTCSGRSFRLAQRAPGAL